MATVDVRSMSLAVLAVLGVVAALKLAAEVLIPITLSISLSYALMPLVSAMKRRLRIPEAIGAALSLAFLVALIAFTVAMLQTRATGLLDTIPQATQRIGRLLHNTALDRTSAIRKLTAAAEALERAAGSALPAAPAANAPPPPNLRSHVLSATGATLKALGETTVVLALSYFLLISGHSFKRKLVRISGTSLREKKLTVQILDEIDQQIQRYLLIQLGTSALVGVATGLIFAIVGLDNAVLWGVAAGILHLVPYIGSTFVVLLSAMFAYLQFNSAQLAAVVGGSALAVAGLVGLGMVPWLTERVGRINAVATFITLLFWNWLWGIPGLLLGIPVMMAIMAICERVSGLESLAELLGADSRTARTRA
ncbi:AI-2E family transporter [Solimonas soli]|uniref:AI-2E family transporter n=1 Tax=Solimonas soli TaxID=413479 RepID=UPI0004BCAD11|nr:AI-2E family transporter [Solimonas soli]